MQKLTIRNKKNLISVQSDDEKIEKLTLAENPYNPLLEERHFVLRKTSLNATLWKTQSFRF